MKHVMFVIILSLLANISSAQQVSMKYSPNTVAVWGTLHHSARIDIGLEYEGFIVEYTNFNTYHPIEYNNQRVYSKLYGIGLLKLIQIITYEQASMDIGGGVAYMNNEFPVKGGRNFNFQLRGRFQIEASRIINLLIVYTHVSNGHKYNIQADSVINVGADNFSGGVQIKL